MITHKCFGIFVVAGLILHSLAALAQSFPTPQFNSVGVNEPAPSAGSIDISGQYQVGGSQINFGNIAGSVSTGQLPSLGANPTATAGPNATNGIATTYMRSDAAPAVQKASGSQFGIVEVDGTSVTQSGGVISAAAGGLTGSSLASGVTGSSLTSFGAGATQQNLALTSSAPTCGTGCASITSGNDHHFIAVAGSSVTTVTVTFGHTWAHTPYCTANTNAGAAGITMSPVAGTTSVTFTFSAPVNGNNLTALCFD
jgi:hypothetical protein